MFRIIAFTFGVVALLCTAVMAQSDSVKYVPRFRDPVIEELRKLHEQRNDTRDSLTDIVEERQRKLREYERETEKWIKMDLANIVKPESPDTFTTQFHFEPSRQYWTGTCWSFSGTSFLETELYRIHGKKIRLSEMFTVYYEWVEKARRFVRERGESSLSPGSETNGVFRTMKLYGAVPLEAYPGFVDDPRHDHDEMDDRIQEYLEFVEDNGLWDEEIVIASVKVIMNQQMGTPPTEFEYEGKTYTPTAFFSDVLKLNLDDYVCLMSTMAIPFYTMGPFDVHDNWWYDSSYYNIPLDEWYSVIKRSIKDGYTMAIGGDISEAGLNGMYDAAYIADFDIPQDYINQHSREYRMYNRTTTDDHGIHLIGYTELDGRDWYLIKESSSRGYHGQHTGYMFYRDDYVRLKMMEYAVHKDAVPDVLAKFRASTE